jgi:hypothetical protein
VTLTRRHFLGTIAAFALARLWKRGHAHTVTTHAIWAEGTLGPVVVTAPDGFTPSMKKMTRLAVWNCELTEEEIHALLHGADPFLVRPANLQSWI